MHCLLRGMVAELEQVPKAFRAAGNQRRAAAKERIKDDAIGHGRVSDRGYWQKLRIITCVKETQKSD